MRDRAADIEIVVDELLNLGLISRVDIRDEHQWADFDLASLAENRIGDASDPRRLDNARRRNWLERASDHAPATPSERIDWGDRCFWLIEEGERVGTIALTASLLGSTFVPLSSFYVLPSYRGLGIGKRTLHMACEALGRRGLGVRLETSWTWQRAVQMYLRQGLWMRSWKRDLIFCRSPNAPPPVIKFSERRAVVSVIIDGESVGLAAAERHGNALITFERCAEDPRVDTIYWLADSTLSLAMALRGWPLVRTTANWDGRWCGDSGPPEALAHRIIVWEAWHHKHGWRVETPLIPDLQYPTWAELEEL